MTNDQLYHHNIFMRLIRVLMMTTMITTTTNPMIKMMMRSSISVNQISIIQQKRSSSSSMFVDAYSMIINKKTTPIRLASTSFLLSSSKRTTWIQRNMVASKEMTTTATISKDNDIVVKNDNNINVNIEDEETMILPTNENNNNLLKIRHSTAHVMAMAVQTLYPNIVQCTIGPWIDNGFYYDFYFTNGYKLTELDLKNIKKEMDYIISQNLIISREEVSRTIAKERIQQLNEPFKLELLDSIKTEPITIYHIGNVNTADTTADSTTTDTTTIADATTITDTTGSTNEVIDNDVVSEKKMKKKHLDGWWDLCAGPHVDSTGQLPKKAIELISVTGSYWRGDENREQLQRIYGIAFENIEQLKYYKHIQKEALKRDHRTLGKKLNLFSIQDQNAGLIFWHPAGSIIRSKIEDFWKQQHRNDGYDIVYTPHIANLQLWKTSGHFDFYKNDMFEPISVNDGNSNNADNTEDNTKSINEQEEDRNVQLYQLKPMNCPFHCLIYKNELRSYRDLPFRWAELGTVYRYERSGTLHGLMRVRGFTQDDAHIFCLPEQLEDEIVKVLDLTESILSRFGFNKYDIMLSTRPEQSVGTDDIWDAATDALRGALHKKQWKYTIDEGGGAFYGPKIDLKIRDAIGRLWQCSTIQCDFNLPERFELEYASADGTRQRPIMVHRAIFGSLERFFGILIENCSGNFPLWLSPIQLKILPVTEAVVSYCHDISNIANKEYQIRIDVDRGNERLAKQIRNAEQQRIPLIGVVGVKEMETNTISIRSRQYGDLGTFPINELFSEIQKCSNDAIEMTMKKESMSNDNDTKTIDTVAVADDESSTTKTD